MCTRHTVLMGKIWNHSKKFLWKSYPFSFCIYSSFGNYRNENYFLGFYGNFSRKLWFRGLHISLLRFRCPYTIVLEFRCLDIRVFRFRSLHTRVFRFRCLHTRIFRFRCLHTRVLKLVKVPKPPKASHADLKNQKLIPIWNKKR